MDSRKRPLIGSKASPISNASPQFSRSFGVDADDVSMHLTAGRQESKNNATIHKTMGKSPHRIAHKPLWTTHYLAEKLRPFVPYLDKPASFWETADKTAPTTGHWTAVEVIRSWFEICDLHHGACCHSTSNGASQSLGVHWLVDVRRLCLVRAKPDMKYFALSYVWGQSSQLCASKSNIEQLQQEKALDEPVSVPRTIRDAMELVALLEGTYLWVDALCILQDDDPDKEDQLTSMGDIYADAVATIVAASGRSAEAGLWGPTVFPGGRQGQVQHEDDVAMATSAQSEARFGPSGKEIRIEGFENSDMQRGTVLQLLDGGKEGGSTRGNGVDGGLGNRPAAIYDNEHIMSEQTRRLMNSKWYSRGWTFQEQLFSRRKVVFQGTAINWECGYAARTSTRGPVDHIQGSVEEEFAADSSADLNSNQAAAPLPDLHRFARLIALYNKRELTFPEDAMDAFEGVISTTAPQYAGGFIMGLPQMFFDAALLWQPWNTITRRTAKRIPEEAACLPSWSWVGWKGNINSESWRSAYDFMKGNPEEYSDKDITIWQPASWRTISTVEWFRLDDTGGKQPIHAIGHQYRDQCLSDSGNALPTGWSRHTCDQSARELFRHDSDPSREFWYPIPLVDRGALTPPHIHCKLLWFQTRRAFLRVGSSFRNTRASQCLCYDLLDEEGSWAGVLRHHLHYERKPSTEKDLKGNRQELVELSAGSVVCQETEEVSFDELPRAGFGQHKAVGRYEFYNVMAIEWNGTVAYRTAVGRVAKEAWDRMAGMEKADIVLG